MTGKTNPPLIIKKYENRRLYNTLSSQYINQEQVADLVRQGHDIRVIDAATGEDITRLVLAQIVLEDAKAPGSVFPLDVLRQMIIASGKATQESALQYMKTMMEIYQSAFRAMPTAFSPFQFMPGGWDQQRNRPETPAESNAEISKPQPEDQTSEVAQLRQRLEELEAALNSQKGKTKKKTSRRKS